MLRLVLAALAGTAAHPFEVGSGPTHYLLPGSGQRWGWAQHCAPLSSDGADGEEGEQTSFCHP